RRRSGVRRCDIARSVPRRVPSYRPAAWPSVFSPVMRIADRPLATLCALLAALAGLLVASGPADAAARLVIKGRGWGHGIGMSQYGAKGFADRGADYKRILGHYY